MEVDRLLIPRCLKQLWSDALNLTQSAESFHRKPNGAVQKL
jgi:hypothetical protein